jgi:SRSO17 transposase
MTSCDISTAVCIEHWPDVFVDLYDRLAHRCARIEVRERLRRYLSCLLGRVERKNGWQLAEAIGDADPQGVQRLLRTTRWDVDVVQDDLRTFILHHLGDEASGVLIVDETGFLKKGRKSCGVARQYTGTAGDTVNCQVGVFLAYASAKGAAFLDRALYLLREWMRDQDRRAESGIPKRLRFATKITQAEQMLARAFAVNAPAQWIVADSGYGRSGAFRRWLEKRGRAYAVMVPRTNAIHYCGGRERVEQLAARLTEEAWMPVPTGKAASAERMHEWACLPLSAPCATGMRRWLLVRRDPGDPGERAYWLAYGPAGTTVAELVRVCDSRWQIEECFAQAKGEVGMDQYEVRTWEAWHRFITLCLVAHAALAVLRAHAFTAETTRKRGRPGPDRSHLPWRKRADWSWRLASRRRTGRSGLVGPAGAGRIRQSPPAAIPRAVPERRIRR